MTQLKKKRELNIILFLSIFALVSAYFIEHILNHKPCNLCLLERVPYILIIILITLTLIFQRFEKLIIFLLSLIFLSATILSFYHFGIEQGFFNESIACATNNLTETLSKEQLLEELKQNSISCKNVSFRIFGLSLAAFNAIFSVILSAIFIKLFNNYGKN